MCIYLLYLTLPVAKTLKGNFDKLTIKEGGLIEEIIATIYLTHTSKTVFITTILVVVTGIRGNRTP